MRIFAAVMSVILLSLAGCGDKRIEYAHDSVKIALSDPDSAKFENDRVVPMKDGRFAVCGSVNAKNRMGGYIGYRMYIFDGYDAHIMGISDASDFAGKYLEVCDSTKK